MALVNEQLVKAQLFKIYEIVLDLSIIELVQPVLIACNCVFNLLDRKALFTIFGSISSALTDSLSLPI